MTRPIGDALGLDQSLMMRHAATRLADEFDGIYGTETIERFLHSSFDQFADRATVGKFLPLMDERFARHHETVRAADVVTTMGCGDACPIFPGKRYEEWVLDDPAGLDLENVRPIRDHIARHVRTLLAELNLQPVATVSS